MSPRTAIVWFRRDLRIADNPSLIKAAERGERVLAVYIHAPHEEGDWPIGSAANWWLHHSLQALQADLSRLGIPLLIRRGNSGSELRSIIAASGADAVYWNRRYEPAVIERDRQIKASLADLEVIAESDNAHLLIEPWTIATQQGEPYKVFTPFWRKAQGQIPRNARGRPDALLGADASGLPTLALADLGLLPKIRWDRGFMPLWTPGEAGAAAALHRFLDNAVLGYKQGRDRPDQAHTSRLSPHLAFGEISARQIVDAIHTAFADQLSLPADAEHFIRELGWREFSYHLLYHFPRTANDNLNPGFANFPWAEIDTGKLGAWQRGQTGIPIVDAGMRELWQTGWMHNRVRMVVASFLTKNLRYHWLHGARWFFDTLLDADLANNTQGWQWSAGTGADAAPYFRIFNPVLQGERFDPEGDYVRRFVPELARVPRRFLHQPWTLPARELATLGLADSVYAQPIVDLAETREDALRAYRQRGEELLR